MGIKKIIDRDLSSISGGVASMVITPCPYCGKSFRYDESKLKESKGKINCVHCNAIVRPHIQK